MQTREAPDFWGLHKNKNCAFPLMFLSKIIKILILHRLYFKYRHFLFIEGEKQINITKKTFRSVFTLLCNI